VAESRISLVPGLLLTASLAYVADVIHTLPFPPFTIGTRHPIDTILITIVLGMLLRNLLKLPRVLGPGIKYAVVSLLPLAIVLMGARLDFRDVARISGHGLFVSVACVSTAITLTLFISRRLGIGQKLAILLGVGTAICGGTAIVATAPVIEAEESETAFAVTTVTALGLAAIFIFPAVGAALSLSQFEFGVWAGTAIHATPQVMAAGFAYGDQAGEVAVVVKLVRVLLLAPVVVGIGMWYGRSKRKREQAHVTPRAKLEMFFPPFVFGFVLMALANTLHLLPDFTLHLKKSVFFEEGPRFVKLANLVTTVSAFLIAMSMAGVGLGVDLKALAKTGPKALYVGTLASIGLALVSLALLKIAL